MIIKTQIRDCFNRSAQSYDQAADIQSKIAEKLAFQLRGMHANSILEIGCGTGLLSQYLPQFFPQASLCLSDIAPAMVQQCQQRFVDQARVKMMCMDGEKLKLDSTFDLIVSSMALHWFSDLKQGLKNIIKQLNPRGSFVFSLLGENSFREWREGCELFGVSAGTPLFPSVEMLQKMCEDLECSVQVYKKVYSNASVLLDSLKCLGANATPANYVPLPAGKLRQIIRHFSDGIEITYQIIYGKVKRAKN